MKNIADKKSQNVFIGVFLCFCARLALSLQIMKLWIKYISACLIVVFVFSSVLQFHHHDVNGEIDLYNFDNTTCVANHRCCHVESPETHDKQHDNDSDCSLKLSTQKITRPTSLLDIYQYSTLTFFGILNPVLNEFFAKGRTPLIIAKSIGLLSCVKSSLLRLRAPPASL